MSASGRGILIVSPDYKPNVGGEAELAFGLARALHERGNQVTVLAPAHLGAAPEDADLPGRVARVMDLESFWPLSTLRGWLAWPRAMAALLGAVRRAGREAGAEVVLVTTYMTWPTLAVRLAGLPYGLFLHGEDISLVEKRGGWVERLFRSACRSARRIFLNSEFSRGLLLRRLPELAPISLAVGCAVRTDVRGAGGRVQARRTLGWDGRPVLLTIANLYAKKGIHTVIRALPEIRRSHQGTRYVVVGEGPEEPVLRAVADREGVADQVEFLGRVDGETKNALFAASDVYVMVSEPGEWGEEEGFGITFLEANWHGVPVVGSRCGGIPESVENGVNGLLVEPGRPAEVAEAVRRLLGNPELREELARRGRDRIEERFNWPAIARRVEAGLFLPRRNRQVRGIPFWRRGAKGLVWMVRGMHLCGGRGVRAFLACRRAGAVGEPVELRVRGLPFALLCRPGTSDADVLWDTFGEGFHRPSARLAPGATILDLGANVGYTAVDLAARHPDARVIAVELDPDNAALAARNLRPYGGRCVVLRAAVWSHDGEVAYGGDSAWGLHVVPGEGEGRRAPAIRVPTLLRRFGVDQVDYVKMDIEGGEAEVLRDDGWMDKVGSIKVEVHPPATLESCTDALRRGGFDVARDLRHRECLWGSKEGR